jgi:hypothetical protein
MKKILMMMTIALGGILCTSNEASAQSIKDIFNSSTVKNAITSITGGKTLSVESLVGTWTYTAPAVALESDDVLSNVAGSVATTQMEKKLQTYCTKAGMIQGVSKFTFNKDSTFTSEMKGKTLKGLYSFDAKNKTVSLSYGQIGRYKMNTLVANAVLTDNQLKLVFNSTKVLNFLSTVAKYSSNTTLQTISQLSKQYKGMKMGFEFKK